MGSFSLPPGSVEDIARLLDDPNAISTHLPPESEPESNPEIRYQIVPQMDRTFAVQIEKPDAHPVTIAGFGTEEAAAAWIDGQQNSN